MLANLRDRLTYANVVSSLALFLVVGGGAAYASHETIFSNDIVDGEVRNPDLGADAVTTSKIQNSTVANADVAPNAITATRLASDSVETSEIANGNVFNADIAGGTITSSRIADNTLTGADIDESTLNVPRARAVLQPVGNCAAGGFPQSCTMLNNRGFASAHRIDNGSYCLVPTDASGVDLSNDVPSVDVELTGTTAPKGNGSAMWAVSNMCVPTPGSDPGWFVDTERIPDPPGPAADANDVAFTIVVP